MLNNTSLNRQSGIGTPTALVLLGGLAAVGMGVASLAGVADSNGGKAVDHAGARALAESGVHALYASMRKVGRESGSPGTSLPATSLAAPGGTGAFGTYSGRVVSAGVATSQVDMGDGSVATRTTTSYLLEGTGHVRGAEQAVRASFVATLDRSNGRYRDDTVTSPEGEGNGVPFSVCPGAVMANGRVVFRTDEGFRTTSSDKTGHVVANKGIVWTPASGTKAGFSAADLLAIEGQYQVPGAAEYAHIYDRTVGPEGLGNPNGRKNYRSPHFEAADGNPALEADTVARRQGPRPYPSADMFAGWDSEWRAKTSAARSYDGSVDTANFPQRDASGATVLTTPAYIDGDLLVRAGATLKLVPHSTEAWKNVVYVNGDVSNLSSLKNLGVTLVVRGKYSDGPAARYAVEDADMGTANLISMNPAGDAVTFSTDQPQRTGLVYAAYGGVRVSGRSPDLTGKLVSAGAGDAAGVFIEPRGGTAATIRYDPRTGGNRHIVPSAETTSTTVRRMLVEPGTIVRPYDPGRLEGWTHVRG